MSAAWYPKAWYYHHHASPQVWCSLVDRLLSLSLAFMPKISPGITPKTFWIGLFRPKHNLLHGLYWFRVAYLFGNGPLVTISYILDMSRIWDITVYCNILQDFIPPFKHFIFPWIISVYFHFNFIGCWFRLKGESDMIYLGFIYYISKSCNFNRGVDFLYPLYVICDSCVYVFGVHRPGALTASSFYTESEKMFECENC